MKNILLLLICLVTTRLLEARDFHPYSITIVHADLQDNRIILTVRTNAEDLIYFHELVFDSILQISEKRLMEAALHHSQVISTGFYILDQQKRSLPSRITSTDFSSLKGAMNVGAMSLLKYPLTYTLEFELNPSIELLEFHQDLGTPGLPAVSFLSISRNTNTLIQHIEITREKPFTMVRNAVSIRSTEENRSVVSYIIVSDTRVIHELTMPSEILQSFLSMENKNQKEVLQTMQDFIKESSSVQIDSITLQPEITALLTEEEPLFSGAMIHVRLEYSLAGVPKEVRITWENFNWKMRWFKSIVDAFGKKSEHNFSRFQPMLKVERNLKLKTE